MGAAIAAAAIGLGSAGASAYLGHKAAGKRPKPVHVPTLDEILSGGTQANLANIGDIEKVGSQVNKFNLDQALELFGRSAPGTEGASKAYLGNIESNLAGTVDPETEALLQRRGAEYGVGSGTVGGTVPIYKYLRNLGLTSTQRADVGGQQLTSLLGETRKYTMPQPFDPTAFLSKPSDAQRQSELAYQNDIYNSQVAAAPDPKMSATAASLASAAGTIGSIYPWLRSTPITRPPTNQRDLLGSYLYNQDKPIPSNY